MSQITLLSSINRTTDYPITVSSTADSHCGTLQLILGSDWTNQMIHELPAINISILTADGSKFLSFDVNMSTVNEELRNKDRSLTPTEPYSIAVYDIPKDITFSITPLFDQYALKAHNDLINDGNIEIFETSDKGIVDTDSDNYSPELWTTPTDTFDITIIFDNSNVSSSGSGGGGDGTSDYTDLVNKPSINNVTLVGNKSLSDLGIVNPMMIKGRVNSVSDLPQVAEPGWVYFVGRSDDADLREYVYTEDNEWEFLGYLSIVIDSALSTTSENPVQNKVITNAMVGEKTTGKQYVIDGQTVTAGDGAEIFNDYVNNKAAGQYSHAEGFGNTASGAGAHAEGYGGVRATGQGSHAEGSGSTAFNTASHAEGSGTTAYGLNSHAEGSGSAASGNSSHAEGNGTQATGDYSHAEGEQTRAASSNQHVQGKYNVADSNGTYAFIIGNGTSENARHNAFAIDWNGNIYVNNSATGVNVETLPEIYSEQSKDTAALTNLINTGSKNLMPTPDGQSVPPTRWINVPIVLQPGTYRVFFGDLQSDDTDDTRCQAAFLAGSTQVSNWLTFERGTNVYSGVCTITAETAIFRLYPSTSYAMSEGDTVTFSDCMICKESDWQISQTYVPYCPTLPELYALIKSYHP